MSHERDAGLYAIAHHFLQVFRLKYRKTRPSLVNRPVVVVCPQHSQLVEEVSLGVHGRALAVGLEPLCWRRHGAGGTPRSLGGHWAKVPRNSRTIFWCRLTIRRKPLCPKASRRSRPNTRARQNSMSRHHSVACLGMRLGSRPWSQHVFAGPTKSNAYPSCLIGMPETFLSRR